MWSSAVVVWRFESAWKAAETDNDAIPSVMVGVKSVYGNSIAEKKIHF